jgi:hypothetical protein
MRIGTRHAVWGLIVLTPLAACAPKHLDSQQPPANPQVSTTTAAPAAASSTVPITASPTTENSRTEKWIDLQVGDCLAGPPPTDPNVLTVSIVDCTTPHQAEVFSRAPVAVNAAIADVANRDCAAGFSRYTGQSLNRSPFTVTYLIDSSQDRTTANPTPSTVICLLQPVNGRSLEKSARH